MLEMGEPVRIIDLAETMIRLSGLEPERDIAIEIVGARPGEKFHEDLFNPYERPQPTPAQKILRAEREPLDPDWVEQIFAEINLLVLEGDAAALAQHVAKLSSSVPDRARTRRYALARRESNVPGLPRRLARAWRRCRSPSRCTTSSPRSGADAGFASIIGLAILVLLYFAQARETATLRARADEADCSVRRQLEARVAELTDQRPRCPPRSRSRAAEPARRRPPTAAAKPLPGPRCRPARHPAAGDTLPPAAPAGVGGARAGGGDPA